MTVDAVNSTDGVLETAGEMLDAVPYGFAVQKGSGYGQGSAEGAADSGCTTAPTSKFSPRLASKPVRSPGDDQRR